MIRRVLICEGPEDLVALREIALAFGSKPAPRLGAGASRGPGGADRSQRFAAGRAAVEVKVASSAKGSLVRDINGLLVQLPPPTRDANDERTTGVAFVFDPDEDPRTVLENEMDAMLATLPRWKVRRNPTTHRWTVARDDGYRLVVHAVAWRGVAPNRTLLPDHQNLERLLCDIARAAFPREATVVDRWLGEMNAAATKHPWKSAMHMWCALVEPRANEMSAPARFLRQNDTCRRHARSLLQQVSIWSELRPLLVPTGGTDSSAAP